MRNDWFATRPTTHTNLPFSASGRHLGVIGYAEYVPSTTSRPAARCGGFAGSANFGNFVAFAFHPDGERWR